MVTAQGFGLERDDPGAGKADSQITCSLSTEEVSSCLHVSPYVCWCLDTTFSFSRDGHGSCVLHASLYVSSSALRSAYVSWCLSSSRVLASSFCRVFLSSFFLKQSP